MRAMSAVETIDPLAAVRDLRPQTYAHERFDKVIDPVIEPMWSGLRVLAAIDGAGGGGGGDGDVAVLLVDDGEPVAGMGDLESAMAGAIRADSAIIDGVVIKTSQYDEAAADLAGDLSPRAGRMLTESLIGRRRNVRQELADMDRRERMARTFEPGQEVAFVALDLLQVDGEWLLDVPLLERKRQLEAVLAEATLVRRGTFVRPPFQGWVGSWRAQGFSGLVFKAANGRYVSGGVKDDWITTPMPRR